MKKTLWAHYVLAIVAKLYGAQRRRAAQVPPARRCRSLAKEEHSRPLLNVLKTWLDAEVFLPEESVRQRGHVHVLNQWAGAESLSSKTATCRSG
ncbi:MAG: hypothetical protein U0936_27615 [Planctomycetaceae bacterium]